jgi:hypothetical protein
MLLALILAAAPLALPYHLSLQANPAAPFPFLAKFGTVTLHVYNGGVRADTMWLNGFSRNGTDTVTVENPLGRMYTNVPVSDLVAIVQKMSSGHVEEGAPPAVTAPVSGKVAGIQAKRYRLLYGPEAWIDVWTTDRVPENPQLRKIVESFVIAVAPMTAKSLHLVKGMPLYVELNFEHYKKLPLVYPKEFLLTNAGQEKALSVGNFYIHASVLDALWK